MTESPRRLHVLIDCGGSKTAVCISTSSPDPIILARGSAGPSNFKDNGLKVFVTAIRTAVLNALQSIQPGADLPIVDEVLSASEHDPKFGKVTYGRHTLYSAWIGASGVDAVQDVRILEPLLSRLLGIPMGDQRLVIANDAHIFASPLIGAGPNTKSAIVAIAGTGSVVVSFKKEKNANGGEQIKQLARSGGWGFMLGDDGAGFFAGREAVREVLRVFEEERLWAKDDEDPQPVSPVSPRASRIIPPEKPEKETLTTLLLSHFGLSSPDELFSVVYAPDPGLRPSLLSTPSWALVERKQRLVSLAPLVFRAAFELKDPSALRALRISAGGLAQQIAFLCSKPGQEIPAGKKSVIATETILCFGGSLFKVADYRNLLISELANLGQTFAEVVFVEDAAKDGALGLAQLFR